MLCDGDEIGLSHLPTDFFAKDVGTSEGDVVQPSEECADQVLIKTIAAHQGSRKELAEKLGMSERTLYRRISILQRLGKLVLSGKLT